MLPVSIGRSPRPKTERGLELEAHLLAPESQLSFSQRFTGLGTTEDLPHSDHGRLESDAPRFPGQAQGLLELFPEVSTHLPTPQELLAEPWLWKGKNLLGQPDSWATEQTRKEKAFPPKKALWPAGWRNETSGPPQPQTRQRQGRRHSSREQGVQSHTPNS